MTRAKIISNKLKEARVNMNYTQEVLAKKINESSDSISKWETGRATPNLDQLKAICSCLNVSIDDLLDNRLIHLKQTEKLIDFAKSTLELINGKSPKEFYEKFRLVNKEQILVFPKAACQQLLYELEEEIKKNLLDIDLGSYYFYILERVLYGNRSSKVFQNINESMVKYISNPPQKISKEEISAIEESETISTSYEIVKKFITFWVWINQMITYMPSDLTKNGLALTIDPISDEEFYSNKKYYPSNPGFFLYRIFLTRMYKELISNKLIDQNELEEMYEYHLNDAHIDDSYFFAKEKFNYINKVKFY